MYQELVQSLTKDQIDTLASQGVIRSTVSAWKHGKRLPTRAQTILLAEVCKVDAMDLERELMILEAAPEQRALFQRLLKIPASAIALLFLVLGLASNTEKAFANQQVKTPIDKPAKYTS